MHHSNNHNDTSPGKGSARVTPAPGQPEGADYYFNEEGLLTFTAKYLLNRGYCCGNGCKHCPYDYEAVPEPRRSSLLAKRNNPNSSL